MKNIKDKMNISTIFILAIPIIIEYIFQTLLGTTDTYFAGGLHDNAIAAIGVTNLIVNIFIACYTAISVGSTAIISRHIGEKNYKSANIAVKQSILLGTLMGLLIGIISFIFCKPILKISGATDAILDYAIPYYMIVAVPSVFLCLSLILSCCLRAIKDTKTPMIAAGIANIINILLNYIFINLGWGIIGLAVATTISRVATVGILITKLVKSNNVIQIQLKDWHFEKAMVSSIARIGIPAGIEKLIMRFGQLVYNSMIISLGTSYYVAHNIAGSIEGYSYIPAFGFGMATATLVGISLGEKDGKKARKITFFTNAITIGCMVIIGIIFYVFAPQLARLFTKTIEVQDMVVSVLRLIAYFQPFAALTQIMTSALQGAGDTKFPMYTTLIGIWGVRVGIGYVLAVICGLGLIGVWYGYALDLTIRGILLTIRFLKGRWVSIQI